MIPEGVAAPLGVARDAVPSAVHGVNKASNPALVPHRKAAISFTTLVCSVIAKEYGDMRHAPKILGRITGASPRTARNWIDGSNPPSSEHLVLLMSQCAALRNEINKLCNGY